MHTILVPTDFSNEAYNALFYATQLLKSKVCTFYILNTFNETTPLRTKRIARRGGKALIGQLRDESSEGLQGTYHKIVLDNNNPDHTFHVISENRGLTETISKIVQEKQIDMVVVGNKGVTGAKTVFWGSNTTRIINEMKQCPILTVPKEIDFKIPRDIAFATDYKRSYSAEILNPIQTIASLFNSSVRIMHINEKERLDKYQESNSNTLREYLSKLDHSVHWMPYFGSKVDAITLFLKELDIDMLTMVNYSHNFLGNLLREPVIKRVNFNLEIPFLVIPCQD
ncbi:MAG: universal stress protein [Saonia sp.]